MDRMQGSMGTLSAMQLTADTTGLDAECKALLHRKEVVSIILKGTVEEYEGYSMEEIMGFIEADSMEEAKEVSAGRTNAQLRGDNATCCSGRRIRCFPKRECCRATACGLTCT